MKQLLPSAGDVIGFLSALTNEGRTGEVLLQSGEESAKVYLNNGRVVWAFATGQVESFQSILIRENLLSKERLLEGIKESRRTGKKNLEDILAVLGIQDEAERRSIVERHTKAAFQVILTFHNCSAQFNALGSSGDGSQGIPLERLTSVTPLVRHAQESAAPRASYKPDLTVQPVRDINEALERFRLEIPHFLAAVVVDGKSSMPIAAVSDAPELDTEVVSAYYQELMRAADNALKALGRGSEGDSALSEIFITSKDDFVLLRSMKGGSHFLYLLLEGAANPGMAKLTVRRYLEALEGFLS